MKYQLYTSVPGNELIAFMKSQSNYLMDRIKQNKGFDNYPNYKNLYFSYLLSFMRDLKAKYRIKNINSLEEFEQSIGKYFEDVKNSR